MYNLKKPARHQLFMAELSESLLCAASW